MARRNNTSAISSKSVKSEEEEPKENPEGGSALAFAEIGQLSTGNKQVRYPILAPVWDFRTFLSFIIIKKMFLSLNHQTFFLPISEAKVNTIFK
jgi:hypothetical protein